MKWALLTLPLSVYKMYAKDKFKSKIQNSEKNNVMVLIP